MGRLHWEQSLRQHQIRIRSPTCQPKNVETSSCDLASTGHNNILDLCCSSVGRAVWLQTGGIKISPWKYVVAEENGDANANRSTLDLWEVWTVLYVDGDKAAFKSAHGKFLVAEPSGAVNANRPALDDW